MDTPLTSKEEGGGDLLCDVKTIPQLDEEKKFFIANMAFTVTPEQLQAWFSVRED